jgi:hypothetical protein
VEIREFRENGVTFTDGSELDVDSVIFAWVSRISASIMSRNAQSHYYSVNSTGYQNIRPTMKKVFGADTIVRTHEVWGMDAEGELKGCYRPSGHPGVRRVFSINRSPAS